jgi:guanine deaminase
MAFIIKGIIITCNASKKLVIYNPGFMVVNDQGTIQEITTADPHLSYPGYTFLDHSNHLLIPGLVDLHNHLPQFAYAGLGAGQLLEWLATYTFPREQQFADPAIATTAAEQFFSSLVAAGTTTTVTYVTVHEQATDIAFAAAEATGIRAIIGKVMMDQQAPIPLQENTELSLSATEQLIKKWHRKNNKLFYAVTPRFAITCSAKLLTKSAELAQKYDTYLQTHLSENLDEIAAVKRLFPHAKHYTDVYHQAGLLGPKTIMAHCIYLSPEEQKILHDTQTATAHCPTSNRFVMSGIMPVRYYVNVNMRIGLGSDVAGGYSLSMLHELRECLENSKTLAVFDATHPTPLTLEEGFYLATLGGAAALGLDATIGSLEAGKAADFVVLDPQIADPYVWKNTYHEPCQLLDKCIYATLGNPVIATYVQGEKLT